MSEASEHFYQGCVLNALAGLVKYNQWIIDLFQPHLKGDAVELSCGIGTISRLIEDYFRALDERAPMKRSDGYPG